MGQKLGGSTAGTICRGLSRGFHRGGSWNPLGHLYSRAWWLAQAVGGTSAGLLTRTLHAASPHSPRGFMWASSQPHSWHPRASPESGAEARGTVMLSLWKSRGIASATLYPSRPSPRSGGLLGTGRGVHVGSEMRGVADTAMHILGEYRLPPLALCKDQHSRCVPPACVFTARTWAVPCRIGRG